MVAKQLKIALSARRPSVRPYSIITVTVHSDLRLDELLSYMQGMGCSELGKKTIFIERPVPERRRL